MTTPALVSQAAWAERLGVSIKTFGRWRQAGRIPFPLAIPGHPRWSSDTVERVTRELQRAGEGRYFRQAIRHRQQQGAAGVKFGASALRHASQVTRTGSDSPLHSIEAKR